MNGRSPGEALDQRVPGLLTRSPRDAQGNAKQTEGPTSWLPPPRQPRPLWGLM